MHPAPSTRPVPIRLCCYISKMIHVCQLNKSAWAAEFKKGREGLEDAPRSGCPATATNQENINRVYHMVMDNTPSRLTVNQIAGMRYASRENENNVEGFCSVGSTTFDA